MYLLISIYYIYLFLNTQNLKLRSKPELKIPSVSIELKGETPYVAWLCFIE